MTVTIKSVFDDVCKDVVVDARFIKRIHDYERAFVNRNEDHINFFGGNLVGVHTMRFIPAHRDSWFHDVMEIDDLALEDGIEQVDALDPEWKRANDAMNLSVVWVVYAILRSTKLSPTQKEQGCIDALLVLQYKYLGSLMAHYFRYPADHATMLAVYARLSRKYALKAAGSWSVLLRQRAEEILSPRGIHRPAYETMADKAVVYMVNDIQGRLREIVKSLWAVFDSVRSSGEKIGSERMVMEIDGAAIVKDKTRNYATYIRYLHDVIGDRPSFIRDELFNIVADAMHTMPPKLLRETLEWMSINHRVKGAEEVEQLVDETLIHAFNTLASNRELLGGKNSLTPLLVKLRSLYMASRMSDETLLKTKELSERIVNKAVRTKNPSVIASVRTGVQLYIVLRALAMRYYQN